MKILDYFYDNPPSFVGFIPRKKEIIGARVILYGAMNSGKSFLLKNEISTLKKGEFLYINFADLRFSMDEKFFDNLAEFLRTHSEISSLFFDNFGGEILGLPDFVEACEMPKFWISTRDRELKIPGFESEQILPLCFEEFIVFDKRHNEINTIISSFFSQGNGVKNATFAASEILEFEHGLLLANFNKSEISILASSPAFLHAPFSANKIYTDLKEKIKISKDAVYASMARFERESMIYLIPKFSEENRAKKLYFANFNLGEILTTAKDFNKKFVNVVFCELLALGAPIFYTNELDFYLPSFKMGVLVIPFSTSDIVFLRFRKIFGVLRKLGITKLRVVSMAQSGTLEIEGIRCDVVPFGEFALSF